MEYWFELAAPEDVEPVFRLYERRISWMNDKNIRQWNTTGYLDAYPISYYREQQRRGNLCVLRGEDRLAGAVVLLTEDERWADRAAEPAYYVHNLVTSPAVPGAGRRILEEIERLGKDAGKCALRLDCAVDNAFLNAYYESGGYPPLRPLPERLLLRKQKREAAVRRELLKGGIYEYIPCDRSEAERFCGQ